MTLNNVDVYRSMCKTCRLKICRSINPSDSQTQSTKL